MVSARIVPFSGTIHSKTADFAPNVPVFGTISTLSGQSDTVRLVRSDGDVPFFGTSPAKKAENDGDVPVFGTSPTHRLCRRLFPRAVNTGLLSIRSCTRAGASLQDWKMANAVPVEYSGIEQIGRFCDDRRGYRRGDSPLLSCGNEQLRFIYAIPECTHIVLRLLVLRCSTYIVPIDECVCGIMLICSPKCMFAKPIEILIVLSGHFLISW